MFRARDSYPSAVTANKTGSPEREAKTSSILSGVTIVHFTSLSCN